MSEILTSVIAHFTSYFLLNSFLPFSNHLPTPKQRSLTMNIISTLSTLFTVASSIYSQSLSSGVNYKGEATYLERIIISNTIGYLSYQLSLEILFGTLGIESGFHHIAGIIGSYLILTDVNAGSAGVCNPHLVCLCLSEIPSPFYHIRNILHLLSRSNTKYAILNEVIQAIASFGFKLGLGWFVLFNIWVSGLSRGFLWMGIGIYGLAVYWGFRIASVLKKRVFGKGAGIFETIINDTSLIMITMAFLPIVLPKVLIYYFNIGPINIEIGGFKLA